MNTYDAVFHLDSADEAIMKLVLKNAANYLAALAAEKFELDIVANGPGVVHFCGDNAEIKSQVEALAQKGVLFKLCANALRDKGINPANVWACCGIVPAGLVEIVHLQKAGFAYIKP